MRRRPPDPEVALEARLDVAYARYIRDHPRKYPLYVGMLFTQLVDIVRCGRLEAEAERRAFRYPVIPRPPNYSLFR